VVTIDIVPSNRLANHLQHPPAELLVGRRDERFELAVGT